MRHRKGFNHLGRKSAHRKAMMANMATSLIMHKRITTTVAKAKALRTYVEPLITKSKDDTTHSRRVVFSYLQDKNAVSELFRDVATKIGDRPGGYTRILKTGTRLGDNADMCIIELVDYNENLLDTGKAKSKSRRRRGSKKKEEGASQAEAKAFTEVKEETAEVESKVENITTVEEPANEEVVAEETAVAEDTEVEVTTAEAKKEAPAEEEKSEEEEKKDEN
ncbi:MAG: 50S ribosomal protein L17 [Bacteroidales bacterium]|nr:50S ribosomal protein L17 [Bacteroidales bacterium]